MPQYGEARVDYLTFTTGTSPEANVTVAVSGLVRNPTFSGIVTVSGGDLNIKNNITNSGNYNTVTGNITTTSGTISGAIGQFTSGVIGTLTVSGTVSGIDKIFFESGSAASPPITFIDDGDTGIFTVQQNTISIATSGNEWWRISGNGDTHMFSSGALKIPSGTTAARPAASTTGMIRYNTTLNQFEGYDGDWAILGGGATGSGGDRVFVLNEQNVTTSYTLPSGENATSCGPIYLNSGVTVTIGTGENWSIV
jgi:hypothetical protein